MSGRYNRALGRSEGEMPFQGRGLLVRHGDAGEGDQGSGHPGRVGEAPEEVGQGGGGEYSKCLPLQGKTPKS